MKFKIRNKEDKEAVKEYIDKLPEGKTYNAEIVRKTTKRSLDQNNLYWLWLSYLAKELGYTQEELHSVFALKFLGASHRVIYEETIVNIPSTKKLTTEQFSAYLEQIYLYAVTELDIQLPQPQDRYFEQFYEQYKNII